MKNTGGLALILAVVAAYFLIGPDKVLTFFKGFFTSKPTLGDTVVGAWQGYDPWTKQSTYDMGQQMLDSGAGLEYADPGFQFTEVPLQ
jgi:hypothetical protein